MKLLISLCAMLMALTATAQDFAATITWDRPGTIRVVKGTSPSYGTAVDLPADATSYIVTEQEEYCFIPTDGNYIASATMDGAKQQLTKDYSTYVQYYKLPAKYQSSKYNGKTVVLTTEAYVYDREFTLDVDNGADKITFQIQDASGNATRALTPENGSQVVRLTQQDAKLYMKGVAYPAPTFYSATINGVAIEQAANGSYVAELTDKALVEVALVNPADAPKPCQVKLVFANNNPQCLNNLRNWSASAFIMPEQLAASDYVFTVDSGTELSVNIVSDADYTLNSITTTPAVEIKNAEAIVSGTRFIVKENTTINIDVTTNTIADLQTTLYTNYIDGLVLTAAYGEDADALTVTKVAEHAAESVTFDAIGYTIPEAVTEYTLDGISGKTGRFFFSTRPGYWIKEGILGNAKKLSDDDADNYYELKGSVSAAVSDCPLYLNIGKVAFDTPAYVYYQGTDACTPRLTSATATGSGANYQDELSALPRGYTAFKFDPEFNASFSARFTVNGSQGSMNFYVYVDGVAQKASEESESLFSGLVLHENSMVKLFYRAAAPATHTLNFTVQGNAAATMTYDEYLSTGDFSAPIKNVGTVTYTFAPADGTVITVNGRQLEAPYQYTATSGAVDVVLTDNAGVSDITVDTADTTVTVVALNGTVLLRNAPRMALNELPAGIYLVNGVKTVIK